MALMLCISTTQVQLLNNTHSCLVRPGIGSHNNQQAAASLFSFLQSEVHSHSTRRIEENKVAAAAAAAAVQFPEGQASFCNY